ncbi:hypothetical protein PAESOLCIP111_00968 [Paenibacillus solanacearum]|uniref:Uncharacterized protein n=1 Tax=Paenibacillus solanacearum TaxID=2048548 RepID=A0A916NNG0_9BACL|nr:hypothetical protein PAESOLCIP111_00968 [Paenibacillus solanacearum]
MPFIPKYPQYLQEIKEAWISDRRWRSGHPGEWT